MAINHVAVAASAVNPNIGTGTQTNEFAVDNSTNGARALTLGNYFYYVGWQSDSEVSPDGYHGIGAIKIDRDKQVSVAINGNDKALTQSDDGLLVNLSIGYDTPSQTLSLLGKVSGGTPVVIGTALIPVFSGIVSISYNAGTHVLTIIYMTATGNQEVDIDLSELIDTYTAGDGLQLATDGQFSVKIDSESWSNLSASAAGLKFDGAQFATASDLSAHINRADNPHSTSAVQTGAVPLNVPVHEPMTRDDTVYLYQEGFGARRCAASDLGEWLGGLNDNWFAHQIEYTPVSTRIGDLGDGFVFKNRTIDTASFVQPFDNAAGYQARIAFDPNPYGWTSLYINNYGQVIVNNNDDSKDLLLRQNATIYIDHWDIPDNIVLNHVEDNARSGFFRIADAICRSTYEQHQDLIDVKVQLLDLINGKSPVLEAGQHITLTQLPSGHIRVSSMGGGEGGDWGNIGGDINTQQDLMEFLFGKLDKNFYVTDGQNLDTILAGDKLTALRLTTIMNFTNAFHVAFADGWHLIRETSNGNVFFRDALTAQAATTNELIYSPSGVQFGSDFQTPDGRWTFAEIDSSQHWLTAVEATGVRSNDAAGFTGIIATGTSRPIPYQRELIAGNAITLDDYADGRQLISTDADERAQWGQITGDLSEQSDVQAILNGLAGGINTKQNKLNAGQWINLAPQTDGNVTISAQQLQLMAGLHIALDQSTDGIAVISSPQQWGNLTGDIDDQTDLYIKLASKENQLIAGDNITLTYETNGTRIDAAGGGTGGASEWGSITGTLDDQTDLADALSTAGATAEWGRITGDIDEQADIIGRLAEKQQVLTAGNNIIIAPQTDGTTLISATGSTSGGNAEWGNIGGNIENQSDLVSQLVSAGNTANFDDIVGNAMNNESIAANINDAKTRATFANITGAPADNEQLLSELNDAADEATWGHINGTLTQQTDLAAALTAAGQNAQFANLLGYPSDNYNLNGVLNKKQATLIAGDNITIGATDTNGNQTISAAGGGADWTEYRDAWYLKYENTVENGSIVTAGNAWNIYDSVYGIDLDGFESVVAGFSVDFSNDWRLQYSVSTETLSVINTMTGETHEICHYDGSGKGRWNYEPSFISDDYSIFWNYTGIERLILFTKIPDHASPRVSAKSDPSSQLGMLAEVTDYALVQAGDFDPNDFYNKNTSDQQVAYSSLRFADYGSAVQGNYIRGAGQNGHAYPLIGTTEGKIVVGGEAESFGDVLPVELYSNAAPIVKDTARSGNLFSVAYRDDWIEELKVNATGTAWCKAGDTGATDVFAIMRNALNSWASRLNLGSLPANGAVMIDISVGGLYTAYRWQTTEWIPATELAPPIALFNNYNSNHPCDVHTSKTGDWEFFAKLQRFTLKSKGDWDLYQGVIGLSLGNSNWSASASVIGRSLVFNLKINTSNPPPPPYSDQLAYALPTSQGLGFPNYNALKIPLVICDEANTTAVVGQLFNIGALIGNQPIEFSCNVNFGGQSAVASAVIPLSFDGIVLQ